MAQMEMTRVDVDALIAQVVPAFQPLIGLDSGEIVGFEALARWPGLPGVHPGVAFPAAAAARRLDELDWACRLAAISTALDAGITRDQALFINVEASSLLEHWPAAAADVFDRARATGLRLVLELTERSLLRGPAQLLGFVAWAREHGFGIALDDVGADPDSLALLPFVAPDVIKLDLALVQQTPSEEQARTMAGVLAHAERHGTVILAEGIETPAHVEQAITLGARYGQGWFFGRPGPLVPAPVHDPLPLDATAPSAPASPFDLVAGRADLRVGRKSVILAMSKHIETQGTSTVDPPVVMAAFQTAERFSRSTKARYVDLARTAPLVVAFGAGLDPEPAPRVRGADLSATDPLIGEWTVVVIGAHYAGALIARDLGDEGCKDSDRRFSFLITHDRDLVVAAGRSLGMRIAAA